jgi:hypothetical protein
VSRRRIAADVAVGIVAANQDVFDSRRAEASVAPGGWQALYLGRHDELYTANAE